jgi:hypothetical protein
MARETFSNACARMSGGALETGINLASGDIILDPLKFLNQWPTLRAKEAEILSKNERT